MSKAVEVGNALLEAFQRAIPMPKPGSPKARKMSDAEVARALETFYGEARKIRIEAGLGIFARARVVRSFQIALTQSGYPPELVTKVVFSLLLNAFIGGAK